MSNREIPKALNLTLFIITFFLNLNLPWNPPVWLNLSDSYDYLRQSQMSLCNKEFYAPHKTSKFSPRPFTTPLFYKIAGSNPDIIIQMQKYIHSLSTFFLVYVLLLFIKRGSIKYFIIVSIYLLMAWWNILGWTKVLLSESLSISLMFCWIASFLYLFKNQNTFSFLIHVVLSILFSFTRDTWPYIILIFYIIIAFIFYSFKIALFKKSLVLILFGGILFFVQQYTVEIGNRYGLPLTNTIVMRIIPDQENIKWFSKHGMPSIDILKKNTSNINFKDSSFLKIYNLYNDTSYNAFHNWANNNGKMTYLKFWLC